MSAKVRLKPIQSVWKTAGALLVLVMVLSGLFLFIFNALDKQLVTREFEVHSQKISGTLNLIILADLHGYRYGEQQSDLIAQIKANDPDAIFLVGDLVDRHSDWVDLVDLLVGLEGTAPVFFVTGNHEIWTEQVNEIKGLIQQYGGVVFEGDCGMFKFADQEIRVCGIDDPRIYFGYSDQVERIVAFGESDKFSILLSHRPEPVVIDRFESNRFDLILSGHTHGGQWRIPGLINGVFAPGQGFFPKFSGGVYELENTKLVISRGLTPDSFGFPRIFNPPELVVVKLIPGS